MAFYLYFIALALASALIAVFSFAVYLFTPPKNFPKNIPTVPFYYALLPLVKDNDQAELYRKFLKSPLENYGAVKIFFGGRWNILIRRPSYIAEVFKYEDIYAKSGNQIKIPHSVLAEYTGENIISGHGDNWKLYTSIMKPALQHDHDPHLIWSNARTLKSMFVDASSKDSRGVAVYGPLQRFTLANLSEVLLGLSFETLQRLNAPLNTLQMKIKPTIFNPIFLNFPFLDHFNLESRRLGRHLVRTFRHTLRTSVAQGHKHDCCLESHNLGCRLLKAHREGILDEKQLNDNLVSAFLAGHENPQLALMSMMYLLGAHPNVQEMSSREIRTLFSTTSEYINPEYSAIQNLPYLTSVIYEALRMFPPISQLINRRTSIPTTLGDTVHIPAGTYVGYNAYSTNRDIDFWGPDADEFRPSRWGSTMTDINQLYRKANAKGAFISFHGGRRACLGQKFAMQELRITMVELLSSLRWRVDASWDGRMTPAGPLYPRNLKLVFEQLGD